MKNLALIALVATGISGLMSCGGIMTKGGDVDSDTIVPPFPHDTVSLPSVPLASAEDISADITIFDSTISGHLANYDDMYKDAPGVFTFRGGPRRDADFGGKISHKPTKVVQVWKFITGVDDTKTSVGSFGGGTGWTGQPLYVEWPDSMMERFRAVGKELTPDFCQKEVIIHSLCGNAYFLSFETGKETRSPFYVGNPVKGTASLDPTMNGNIYVGQGLPSNPPMGHLAYNLFTYERTYFSGADRKAWRAWYACDGSPIVVGGFVFYASENGTLYKYSLEDGNLKLHSTLRYKANHDTCAGMENSLCVYKNYGYFGDNHGDVVCVDLNTLQPIWHYDNHDDIDATIVCEVVGDVPYLYCGCEVDRQGDKGVSHFVKLNGLTGELVWEQNIDCSKYSKNDKHYDGGFYSTPLLGHGNCEGMIFANVCQPGGRTIAEFTAFSTKTGEIIYKVPLKFFSWTSPVAFYTPQGDMYIFTGDSSGNGYLFDAKTGEMLFTERMVNNFESSPCVVGNQFVVGSRGREIYKFEVQ